MFVAGRGGGGGVLAKVLIRDYTGDDTNDRVIDLGDEYDWVCVVTSGNWGYAQDHGVPSLAVGDHYSARYVVSATDELRHTSGTFCNPLFQGKMTGADSTKIKLGGTGTHVGGTNYSGRGYRIVAFQFSNTES